MKEHGQWIFEIVSKTEAVHTTTRSYAEIKSFHANLKLCFKAEAGVGGSERKIPKLPRHLRWPLFTKDAKKELQAYFDGLMMLDERVRRCALFVSFFTQSEEDATPAKQKSISFEPLIKQKSNEVSGEDEAFTDSSR